jgi:subtilisin family serine protease
MDWKTFLRKAVRKFFIFGIGAMCIPSLAWGEAQGPGQGKATEDMPVQTAKPDRVNVLVHVEPGADRGPVRAFAVKQGGRVRYEYKAVLPQVMNLRNIPSAAAAALEKIPGVFKVAEDTYHARLIKLDESTPLINGLQSQVQSAGYNSADGNGVRVCVIDTGIDSDHLMYSDRIDASAGFDFVNNDNDPEDDNGHGSHAAGIAVGGTGLSVNFNDACDGEESFQGVAPGATLIGVKVLDAGGGGWFSDVIAGINHCTGSAQADVINLSLGAGEYSGICDSEEVAEAANNAVDAGVVVVAAAGNEAYTNAMIKPACGSKVIAVGATYKADYPRCEASETSFAWTNCTDILPKTDDLVCFSNNSDNLDVVAPGSHIWSASIQAGGSKIIRKSGTSMAAPQVAGLAAVLLSEADTSLTPDQVRGMIRNGAIDMGAPGFDPGYGYGRVDVLNSLALLGPQCVDGADCNDGNPCTTDTCSDGVCSNQPIECSQGEICVDGVCSELPPECGDGICNGIEICDTCPEDCISGGGGGVVCGNGVCEPGEDCLTCPEDCRGKQVGAAKRQYCCGAGGGLNPVGCEDSRCSEDGWLCSDTLSEPYCCGDGQCAGDEDYLNCAIDGCLEPFCGDGTCDPDEDQCSCSEDCGPAPATETNCSDGIDNDCDGLTDIGDTDCSCLPKKTACDSDGECCSNRCFRGACK